ncbi:Metallo-dependent hydrolase [Phlebopus sp. FC_14]|nr:Metallo-dependent hydrolase [Phlebopus sp. FC_14]
MATIAGPAAAALQSLTASEIAFLQSLEKVEQHAHLNGSIPPQTLLELARDFQLPEDLKNDAAADIAKLESGVTLREISDFFSLFRTIYALTSTPPALARATRAVLSTFLTPQQPPSVFTYSPHEECKYMELRTTPRATVHMSRLVYLTTVLDEIDAFGDRAALIISIDRRMSEGDVEECVDLAIKLRREGRRVVGLDLCGDPHKGDVNILERYFRRARDAGLGLTIHIAETPENTTEESLTLLGWRPDRLGHATFLSERHKALFFADVPQPGTECSPNNPCRLDGTDKSPGRADLEVEGTMGKQNGEADIYKPCIEICLSSNLLCKTVPSLDAHHIRYYLANNHPFCICTDDTLPFRTTTLGEYALLLAAPPLGLGLSRVEVERIAKMGVETSFRDRIPAAC